MVIIIAIIAFGILIAVHELGHFAAAKAFGVKVEEFSLGMGPLIFKKQGKPQCSALGYFRHGMDIVHPEGKNNTARRNHKTGGCFYSLEKILVELFHNSPFAEIFNILAQDKRKCKCL